MSGDCWRQVDNEIHCPLQSLNLLNPKYPHTFPDTLSLSCSGPASRPCVLGFTLPKPLACLLQTTTSYHRTPAARQDSQARPLVFPNTNRSVEQLRAFCSLSKNSPGLKRRPKHVLTDSTHVEQGKSLQHLSLYHILFIHRHYLTVIDISGHRVS